MGDNAGQLLYGVEIGYDEANKLKEKFNVKYFSQIELENGLATDMPYENDEYFIKIADDEYNFSTYNCGKFLGFKLPDTNADLRDKIQKFCEENDILNIDYDKIGWYLIGHYN